MSSHSVLHFGRNFNLRLVTPVIEMGNAIRMRFDFGGSDLMIGQKHGIVSTPEVFKTEVVRYARSENQQNYNLYTLKNDEQTPRQTEIMDRLDIAIWNVSRWLIE